jgi:hypothetical protein
MFGCKHTTVLEKCEAYFCREYMMHAASFYNFLFGTWEFQAWFMSYSDFNVIIQVPFNDKVVSVQQIYVVFGPIRPKNLLSWFIVSVRVHPSLMILPFLPNIHRIYRKVFSSVLYWRWAMVD